MTGEPDRLYFRVRDNGATVFRVDTENRQRRIEMDQIAVVNTNNGQIKPHGDAPPTKDELAEIERWMDARKAVLDERGIDDIFRAVDYLNLTAHWAQTKATDEQLDRFTDDLLMAMHDLRSVLVRKKSDRLMKDDPEA
jgi:hypothetical protein